MNYLAHAYLSFHNPAILAGNMISDFIKGKKQYDYPLEIQLGIRLHRAIDDYTDTHPATKAARRYFSGAVGLYSGAFVDIVYDHFLALDPNELTETAWLDFSGEVYQQLETQKGYLPEKFAAMFPYMKKQNWLYGYRFEEGIRNSFYGLVRRARYLDDAALPFGIFLDAYAPLKDLYADFFPGVKKFAAGYLSEHPIT